MDDQEKNLKQQESEKEHQQANATEDLDEGGDEIKAPEAEEPKNEIQELKASLDEMNNKYLRLYSEFENFRRRTAKERLELISTAGEDVIKDLLTVLDDFERAIESNKTSDDIAVIKEGFQLLYQKFRSTLVQKGLKDMDSLKKDFDTDHHEALTKIPAPKRKLKGKVVDVIEKGYFLNDKVIRYAKVVIGE